MEAAQYYGNDSAPSKGAPESRGAHAAQHAHAVLQRAEEHPQAQARAVVEPNERRSRRRQSSFETHHTKERSKGVIKDLRAQGSEAPTSGRTNQA